MPKQVIEKYINKVQCYFLQKKFGQNITICYKQNIILQRVKIFFKKVENKDIKSFNMDSYKTKRWVFTKCN